MLTIQTVGSEIFKNAPRSFYVFGGPEYGVKMEYIAQLTKHYGKCIVSDTVDNVLSIMHSRHLVPIDPAVYLVKYDSVFISGLNESVAQSILATKMLGTLVCFYESDKDITKCEKYLPDNTVCINYLNGATLRKHLKAEYPQLSQTFLGIAERYSNGYTDGQNLAKSLSLVSCDTDNIPPDSLAEMLGKHRAVDEAKMKECIASRSFSNILETYEAYSVDLETLHYTILSTMLELEKLKTNSRADSALSGSDYHKLWSVSDIYHIFMHTYNELSKIRTVSNYSIADSLMYLFMLICMSPVPSLEETK